VRKKWVSDQYLTGRAAGHSPTERRESKKNRHASLQEGKKKIKQGDMTKRTVNIPFRRDSVQGNPSVEKKKKKQGENEETCAGRTPLAQKSGDTVETKGGKSVIGRKGTSVGTETPEETRQEPKN